MKEIKRPRKQLIWFYLILLIILFAFNFLILPTISQKAIKEVDYGTFMTMTEDGEIGSVQIMPNQILFTDKEEKEIYRTSLMNDPDLVSRLHSADVKFTSQIQNETSPFLTVLLNWVFPIVIFYVIGTLLSRKFMDKAGGANSLMFGMASPTQKYM